MKAKIIRLILIFKERFSGAQVTSSSVTIAYYLLLSLFPLTLVLGGVLPFLNIDPVAALEYAKIIVPEAVQPILEPIITDLLTAGSSGVLTLSSIALLWSASKGVNYLQVAMNRAYGIQSNPNFIVKRILSIFTLLIIFILIIVFVFLFGFGEMILDWIAPAFEWAQPAYQAIRDLKWPVTSVFLFLIMMVVYYITPDTIVRVQDTIPGALLTTAGLLLLVEAFALYVHFANRTLSSFGALSTFFILMFWMNFSSMVVIVGGVLNATIYEFRFGKSDEEKSDLASSITMQMVEKIAHRFQDKDEDDEKENSETGDDTSENDSKTP